MKIIPNPIAFSIGPFSVRWYGLLIALAILIGTILVLRETEKQDLNQEHILNVILLAIPAALIGARLYYVVFNWQYYARYPSDILAIWEGGLAIHGALIVGFFAAFFLLKKYGVNFWQAADIAAPSIILGQALGRWGNFFNQEAYGYEVDPAALPWAMYIDGAYRHPTFLYESIWNLGVFFFLLWLRRKKGLQNGDVFLFYVILYSLGRFFIENLRTDSLMLTANLRIAQVVSIIAIGLGFILILYRRKKHQQI